MTNITDLERTVLISIAENYMTESNGTIPKSADDTWCWTDSISDQSPIDCPDGKQLSGVMSSLIKKELVYTCEDSEGNTSGLSNEGFKVYKTFGRK